MFLTSIHEGGYFDHDAVDDTKLEGSYDFESVNRKPTPNSEGIATILNVAAARFEAASIKPADPADPSVTAQTLLTRAVEFSLAAKVVAR